MFGLGGLGGVMACLGKEGSGSIVLLREFWWLQLWTGWRRDRLVLGLLGGTMAWRPRRCSKDSIRPVPASLCYLDPMLCYGR